MTSEDANNCDFTKDYHEFRKVLLSGNEPARHLPSGSFFEMPLLYYLSNPTDIDSMYCDMTLCAIYYHVNVPARSARNVLTIYTTDCHVGFVRLGSGAEYFRKSFDFDKGPAFTSNMPIQATCITAVLGTIYSR